jgi:hypothetical protein
MTYDERPAQLGRDRDQEQRERPRERSPVGLEERQDTPEHHAERYPPYVLLVLFSVFVVPPHGRLVPFRQIERAPPTLPSSTPAETPALPRFCP